MVNDRRQEKYSVQSSGFFVIFTEVFNWGSGVLI